MREEIVCRACGAKHVVVTEQQADQWVAEHSKATGHLAFYTQPRG